MSTPSTISALQPQHPNNANFYHHHYADYNPPASSHRPPNLSIPRATKLANNSTASSAASPIDSRQLPPLPTHRAPRTNELKSETQQSTPMASSRTKAKKTDWNDFYKNGLPQEVIVIDDDESPEPTSANPLKRTTSQHENKRRRTDNNAYETMPNGTHKQAKNAPQVYDDANSSSTASSARNTSALYSTAPTSLTSVSSAGQQTQQRLDDSRVGQKRKRPVRQPSEKESPEVEIRGAQNGSAWVHYIPPAKPPIKAGEVYTPIIRDVSKAKPPPCLRDC